MKHRESSNHRFQRLTLAWLSAALLASSAESANNALIDVAGSSVPGSMAAGSTASVRVRVKNTGTTSWSPGALHRLGSAGGNQLAWGGFPCGGYMNGPTDGRVFLCGSVGPNATYDFNFQVTAPSSPGTFSFAVRMVRDGVEWFGASNSWNISVTSPGNLPDVVVDSVSVNPPNPAAGQAVTFTSVVRNIGSASTPSGVVIGVGYRVDGIQRTWGVVNGPLAPGASVTIGTNGGSWTATAGTHTLTAVADDVNRFAESNENNNSRSTTFTVGSSGLPDVVVDSVSVNPPNPAAGQAVTFTSVVRNIGSAATPSGVVIGVGYRVDGIQRTWGAVNGPLAPGASVTIGTHGGAWTATPGSHTLTAVADDVNRFAESNENNNSRSITFVVGSGGDCPAGSFDVGDYVLGDGPNLRVFVKNTRGQTETFAYRQGGFFSGLQQQFFIKNDSGENWEEFGLDGNFVYRWRDTSWTDVCTNPQAEAYYEVVDNNRSSFAKWAPRCMSPGQSWSSDVGSQVKAHFEKINNCAECSSQYEGPTHQRMTLVRHHPVYRTIWGLDVPDVIELFTASSTDRFFYAKAYGLVGFRGPDPAGGEFVMGAERIDPGGHNPPNRVPLCGNDDPPSFTAASTFDAVVDYCFDEPSVPIEGIAPNSVRPGVLDGRLQGNAGTSAGPLGRASGAVKLDGATASVVIEESAALELRTGLQVEALIHRESNRSEDGIAGRWYGEDQWLLTLYPEGSGRLVFSVRLEDGRYHSVSYSPPDESYLRSWVHVAARYDAASGLSLHWNGSRVASLALRGKLLAPATKPIHIGDSGNDWSRFHGRIDDVRISVPSRRKPGRPSPAPQPAGRPMRGR